MPSPHLVLSGYYGFGNAGDEAILEAIAGDLRRVDPEVRLSVLTADPESARRLGLYPVPRMKLPAVARALLASDLLISGGGGLLQDSTGINSVLYYLGVCMLARLLGKPVMFYAQGFGPVRSPAARRITRLLASHVQLVTVRDEESAREMRELGILRPPLRVTADPVLSLEPAEPARVREILVSEGLSQDVSVMERPAGHGDLGPLTAVALRPWPGLDLECLCQGLEQFARDHRARYLVVPFQPSTDRPLGQELARRLGPHARLLQRDYPPRELLGLLACTDLVLGMRLHAVIMAANRGVPFLGLNYDPKVERFCQRCGALSLALAGLDPAGLSQALHHLLQARNHARRDLAARVEPMRQSARDTARAAFALAARRPAAEIERELGTQPVGR